MRILLTVFCLLPALVAAQAAAQIATSIGQAGFGFPDNEATSGFAFGYLFDTAGDGFEFSTYTPFDFAVNGLQLPGTTDYFAFDGAGIQATTFFPVLGANAIGGSSEVPTPASTGGLVNLVWFETTPSIVGARFAVAPLAEGWSSGDTLSAMPELASSATYFTIIPEPNQYALVCSILVFVGLLGRRSGRRRSRA